MTEAESTPRRGRRARRLSPEESAALESGQASAQVPGVRRAVAPPGADSPRPQLRKFGRRARIIELTDAPAPAAQPAAEISAEPAPNAIGPELPRDRDGVELGELSVTEAPPPRPAPRYEGRVLHRSDGTTGRPLLWIVWILIAVALITLVALLLTGVLGPGVSGAAALSAAAVPGLRGMIPGGPVFPVHSSDRFVLEDPAA